MAGELCSTFKDVFVIEDKDGLVYEESENETESSDLVFSDKLVNERLLRLESGKSTGLDGLHPQFLESCADHLAAPLATIVQLS